MHTCTHTEENVQAAQCEGQVQEALSNRPNRQQCGQPRQGRVVRSLPFGSGARRKCGLLNTPPYTHPSHCPSGASSAVVAEWSTEAACTRTSKATQARLPPAARGPSVRAIITPCTCARVCATVYTVTLSHPHTRHRTCRVRVFCSALECTLVMPSHRSFKAAELGQEGRSRS